MARLTCDLFSDALGMGTTITVTLPEPWIELPDGSGHTARPTNPPLVYLLHGLSDDHTSWSRFSSVERYADEHGLAVVMPDVARSFYADEVHGHKYWTYLSEELPAILQSWFGLGADPARTFAAGLSMGGYGALKLALRQPERFAAAASLSGAFDLAGLLAQPDRDEVLGRVFGGVVSPSDDLFALVQQAEVPRLWLGCGTDDYLYAANERFVAAAQAADHDPLVHFRAGAHTWDVWDAMLPEVFAWFAKGGIPSE